MAEPIKALAEPKLYPAVLEMFGTPAKGKILDFPAGHGAFAEQLLLRGYDDIDCLDIDADSFRLANRVRFRQHDAAEPLPFPDGHFDYVFSIEGVEHFVSPWTFVGELCRVLKPGGRLIISTPNTLSVDARLKYLVSGYYPRFKALMQNPDTVMNQGVDDAHIAPIYFWQLNYFLRLGGVGITGVGTNARVVANNPVKRVLEWWLAKVIRRNIVRRHFPDCGVTSDAALFGDLLILDCMKALR